MHHKIHGSYDDDDGDDDDDDDDDLSIIIIAITTASVIVTIRTGLRLSSTPKPVIVAAWLGWRV